MIPGVGPVPQALLGTLLTWGLTAAGSALVFVFSSGQRRILDGSLGFAAGVMLAASYWSLLAPAIELAEESGTFGAFSFFPVAVGFALGAAFVYGADLLLPVLGFPGPSHAVALSWEQRAVKEKQEQEPGRDLGSELAIRIGRAGLQPGKHPAIYHPRGHRAALAPGLPSPSPGFLPFPLCLSLCCLLFLGFSCSSQSHLRCLGHELLTRSSLLCWSSETLGVFPALPLPLWPPQSQLGTGCPPSFRGGIQSSCQRVEHTLFYLNTF